MDMAAQATFVNQATAALIPCCLCGVAISPNAANMCVNCIRNQVDISEGIQKQVTVVYCKDCGRYLVPPKHWLKAELESKELLSYCIKRIRGMQRVKLVDANFIWTEPHSKRLKIKLTIQAEVMNGAILQQTIVIEFVVEWNMCPDCNRANTNVDHWKAVAQVRQHVGHKRTFMFLEQLILKHGAHDQCVNIKECHEGIDFYFGNRSHAQKFIDFLQSVVPAKFRHDKQLVSHDTHTAIYNYKYTFSVEIVPICKEDLICLPPKVSQQYGQIGPLLLCTKVSSSLTLTCPYSLRSIHIDAKQFFGGKFSCVAGSRQLIRYVVLDCEPSGERHGRFQLADAQVAREADLGSNDNMFLCRTHLGGFLKPGDIALGYDLARSVTVDDSLDAFIKQGYQLPDVVLVKKCFDEVRAKRRAQQRPRAYKLKHLDMDRDDANHHAKRGQAQQVQRMEDMEQFLNDIEEDPEVRQHVALYKNYGDPGTAQQGHSAIDTMDVDEDDTGDEAALEIPLEDLIDELEGLDMQDS